MTDILNMLAMLLPLLIILIVANLAEWRKQREEPYQAFAILSFVFTGGLYVLMLGVGLSLVAFAAMTGSQPDLAEQTPVQFDAPWALALGVFGSAVSGLLVLIPAVRRWLARLIPIDPDSIVHAVALSLSLLIVVNLTVTLGIGLDNLATMLAQTEEETGVAATSIAGLWGQQILMVLLAVVGVGWPIRRSFGVTMQRLGIVVPTRRQVLIGLVGGVGMVGVVIMSEALVGLAGFGADPNVERLTEQLLGPLFTSPFGVITLGVAAALGEEPLFRGAAQPRFGLLLTATLFALVHSNYGITFSTLIVFALGLVLGVVRSRHNTTTAMILHACYNITLGVIGYIGLQFLQQGQ